MKTKPVAIRGTPTSRDRRGLECGPVLLSAMLTAVSVEAQTQPKHASTPTHQTLMQYAVSKAGELPTPLTFPGTAGTRMWEGARDEDIPVTRSLDHAYNPVTNGKFSLGNVTAWTAACDRWDSLTARFVAGDFDGGDGSGAWHYLGRASHLLQDMTSPLHVFALWHTGVTEPACQFEAYWENHDADVRAILNSIGGPLHSGTLDSSASERLDAFTASRLAYRFDNSCPNKQTDDVRGWMEVLAWIAYFRSTFYGQITMSSSTGNGPATSPFTAGAPFSDGDPGPQANVLHTLFNGNVRWINQWLGDDYYEITDRNGHVFRFMSVFDIDDWAACGRTWAYGQQDSSIRVGGSDEDSDGVRVTGRFWFDTRELGKDTSGSYNRYCYPNRYPDGSSMTDHLHQYYGAHLYPLTVRYNAGLLGLANRRVTIETADATPASGFAWSRKDNFGNGPAFDAASSGQDFYFVAKSEVTLTAPASNAGGRAFVHWLRDGTAFSANTNRSITVNTAGAPIPASGVVYTAEYEAGTVHIVNQPSDRTVPEGGITVFSVVAGGAPPLSYQWQINGVDIPGAFLPSHVTPPVTLADSGAQFRVIVTNAFGSVTSRWATLTVNAANVITWTGAVSTDWNNPTNWSPQTIPTAGDRVVIPAGEVNVPPTAVFAVMDLNNGTITGVLNVAGTLNWRSGVIDAEVKVAADGVLSVDGPGFLGGALVNAGTMVMPGGGEVQGKLSAPGAGITNLAGGLLVLQGSARIGGGQTWCGGGNCYGGSFPVLHNAGTLRASSGIGTTNTLAVSNCVNGGVLELYRGALGFSHGYTQTAGATRLSGGGLWATGPIVLEGGVLAGSGTVQGSVVNAAEVSPGTTAGTITIHGDYTQMPAGALRIEIGGLAPGSEHDRLMVNGPATLDGKLQVTFIHGFAPKTGDLFEVLGYTTRSGDFASSTAGQLGLTEWATLTNLVLVAGSNAFPGLTFAVSGGSTQRVCTPFRLRATARDVDGTVTNLTILQDGWPIASADGSPVATTAEIDYPGTFVFTARAQDALGGTSWSTQAVAVAAYPLHVLNAAGFRANGAFKLCLAGETGRVYQVLANVDPVSTPWVPIGLMESTNGTWRYLDGDATNHGSRYYRAEQAP